MRASGTFSLAQGDISWGTLIPLEVVENIDPLGKLHKHKTGWSEEADQWPLGFRHATRCNTVADLSAAWMLCREATARWKQLSSTYLLLRRLTKVRQVRHNSHLRLYPHRQCSSRCGLGRRALHIPCDLGQAECCSSDREGCILPGPLDLRGL